MPTTERYQVDVFAIVTLIAAVLIVVFLIIAAIYFLGLMNLNPPSSGESTFLFWTSIVLAIIFVGLGIWAIIQIITHRSVVYEEAPLQPSYYRPPTQSVTYPAQTTTTSYAERPTNLSTSLSDIPVTQQQRVALTGELTDLSTALQA
jgi:hypothetical protein